MSHFFTVVIVPGDTDPSDIEKRVGEMLAPFKESLVVPVYVRYTREQLIQRERQEFEQYRDNTYAKFLADPGAYKAMCTHVQHIHYLEQEFPKRFQWTDEDFHREAVRWRDPEELTPEGGIYSTRNPKAQWDWWSLGGRWNGEIRNARRSDESGFNFPDEYRQLNENMLPVKLLDHKLTCWAVLTPDGEWHEKASMGWFGMSSGEKSEEEWEQEVFRLIQQYPNDILVGVDCHI